MALEKKAKQNQTNFYNMKISYSWLKEYLPKALLESIDEEQIAQILTDTGLEIEGVETYQTVKGGLEGLVIGEVKTCQPHPNADKLSVTTVDIGNDTILPVVCGAPNVAAGQKVVVATVGTTLYSNDKSFKIKKAKIRGEISQGMICAEDEIGLGTSHDGIMVLDTNAEIGSPAKDYFQIETDKVYEIGLTPNRIDGASHIGAARDLAAWANIHGYRKGNSTIEKTILPDVSEFKIDNTNQTINIVVEDSNACPRYSGITISDIEVKESPKWLQNRLKAIGLKPINNIVDITNFVLYETGQPLHAFDADKIKGKTVIVKTLDEGTKFITLDEEERKLAGNDLMICNAEEGMCIAGVFGGLHSGVTNATRHIFLESANFSPEYIRRTSKRHVLNTDASFRFERGADPNITIYALKRAALLIKELAGGTISSEIIDVYPNPVEKCEITLRFDKLNRLVGKTIAPELVKRILKLLDFEIISENEKELVSKVPTYRVDVQREADVIEEVLRIYGYNNVELSQQIKSTIAYGKKPDPEKLQNNIAEMLTSLGFNEIMSNSLTKAAYYNNLESYKKQNLVEIINPLSSDLNVMRQTLLFGGLEAIIRNINRKQADLKFYEFGNCYYLNPDKSKHPYTESFIEGYYEDKHLALFITGLQEAINWKTPKADVDFYKLKAYIELLLKRLRYNPDNFEKQQIKNDILAYGLQYNTKVAKNKIVPLVTFGAVNPALLQSVFDMKQPVYYADFNWNNCIKNLNDTPTFKELTKYPEVRRDLALLLDEDIQYNAIKEIAYKTERKILRNVDVFDVYQGKNIEKGKKSYAISFILRDDDKTLKDKQIDKIMNKLMAAYKKQLGAQIR